MTMHLVKGMSSLNTRKKKAMATQTQLKLWRPEWRAENKWRRQRNIPEQTFDQYVAHRLGQAEKMQKQFVPMTTSPLPDHMKDYRERYPSQEMSGAVAAKKDSPVYSGERELLGIAVLHKSCLQPVFNKQDAVDIAKMRRN